jgi:diacylglycerol kinase (ATP)
MKKILYIVNPAAFGGQGHYGWRKFCLRWPEQISQQDIIVTKGSNHAREIASSCQDYDILAAVGGDGVVNEVFSGIMDRQGKHPALAIIPAGTGNDIALNLGIKTIEDAAETLRQGHTKEFDLFRIDCQVDGQSAHRYSFLSCGIGFSAISYSMVGPWMKRLLGSKAAYCFAIVVGALFYKPLQMTVRWQDNEYSDRTFIAIISNAQWLTAGAMRVAPGACMDDGELNVTIIPFQSRLSILRKIAKSTKGTHINESGIAYFPAKRIEVESELPIKLAIDGDVFGTTPAVFTVCPSAIKIVIPEK